MSSKGEGQAETAKTMGTVDVNRPPVSLNLSRENIVRTNATIAGGEQQARRAPVEA